MTKAGLTDFLFASALTSQEKKKNHPEPGVLDRTQCIQRAPPGSEATGWVRTSPSVLRVCLWPEGQEAVTEQIPTVGKKEKKKTEQRVLLSCLCVLTNQRRHTESLLECHCRGVNCCSADGPRERAFQPGYHLGGLQGAEERQNKMSQGVSTTRLTPTGNHLKGMKTKIPDRQVW